MSRTEAFLHRIALAVLALGVLGAFGAALEPRRWLTAHGFELSDGLDGRRARLSIDGQGNLLLAVFDSNQQPMFDLIAPGHAGDPVVFRTPDGATRSLIVTAK